MAYYENRIEHLGGDLILYQRNLATAARNVKTHRKAKWYMKLRLGPRKFVNRSPFLLCCQHTIKGPAPYKKHGIMRAKIKEWVL